MHEGGHVGIYLSRSVETVISILAVLKAGGVYVRLTRKCPGACGDIRTCAAGDPRADRNTRARPARPPEGFAGRLRHRVKIGCAVLTCVFPRELYGSQPSRTL